MSDLAVLHGKTQSNISTPNALNSRHTTLAKSPPLKKHTCKRPSLLGNRRPSSIFWSENVRKNNTKKEVCKRSPRFVLRQQLAAQLHLKEQGNYICQCHTSHVIMEGTLTTRQNALFSSPPACSYQKQNHMYLAGRPIT